MMFIDLFSQTLQFALYLLTFGLLAYGFSRATKVHEDSHKSKLMRRRQPLLIWAVIIIGAMLASGLTWAIIQYKFFPEDSIPVDGIVWVMPVFFSLGLVVLLVRKPRLLWVGLGSVVASLLLVAVIANNYYHYYPTLQAVFQRDTTTQSATSGPAPQSPAGLAKSDVVLEQYYRPLAGQITAGQLLPLDIPSSTSNFSPRQGRIYMPPALNGNSQIRLPVIVLLAGHPGSPLHWEQAGLLSIMNDFARQHEGLAPIVAVVDFGGVNDADTECVDSKLGSAETYLTKDVPAYLKQHYQVQTDPSAWAIGGYSAGGTCAPLITLRNPTVYHSFINISGDAMPSIGTDAQTLATLFDGSKQAQLEHTPDVLLKNGNPLYHQLSGWYFYGKQDSQAMIQRVKTQYELAKKAGLNVAITGVDGPHGFTVWKAGYVQGLPWVSNLMRLTFYDRK